MLELTYEVCGTYQTRRTGVDSGYDVASLASVRDVRDFMSRNTSLDGARKVARILRYVADGSASPRETKQALVLGLPHARGGYGLGIPRMNYEVRANPAARALTGKSFFRCDLCWPEAKLDVEYQSRWAHEGEAKRLEDSRRTNALAAMGWKVVCITNDELDSLAATDAIANTIRRHLGKRAQVRVPDHHARKLRLRRQLGLPAKYE
ncbi:endonuclease domain-containing protein [Gordonibacter sp. 28C]|uniref:endonuclease domain-containing protein n=1 Tax=Gordonibacter sp. 28C TaxID=2078569 RepID=UPI001F5435FB|nr:endonuclease domain-containing protein [Gordonibacter sp. 28C]